jgi:hypothetical protein
LWRDHSRNQEPRISEDLIFVENVGHRFAILSSGYLIQQIEPPIPERPAVLLGRKVLERDLFLISNSPPRAVTCMSDA